MDSASSSNLVSEREFLALPESTQRLEFLDGEVYVPPSPSPQHQSIVGRLYRHLATWADANPPAYVGLAPLDVRLAPARIVQPDLFIALTGLRSDDLPVDQVPELVVEVLSSNRSHDRITKRLIYANAGVDEYWIVDPVKRSMAVCVGLDSMEVARGMFRSQIVPGLEFDPSGLFG